eukprot:9157643-Alexandrium_andersonii.AAC.1
MQSGPRRSKLEPRGLRIAPRSSRGADCALGGRFRGVASTANSESSKLLEQPTLRNSAVD